MLSFYKNELSVINSQILSASPSEVPVLLQRIPLGLLGSIESGSGRDLYPELSKYLPTMASDAIQMSWTGQSGNELLKQSVDFMNSVVHFYETTPRNESTTARIYDANVLDFGCGWGRLARLLLKHVPENQIYAVDPWSESLRHCKEHNVRANFGLSEYLCRELPFGSIKFDLVYAYSVFTHLSRKAGQLALRTIHSRMNPNGVFAITVWDDSCWDILANIHENLPINKLKNDYQKEGFAFLPHNNREAIEGEVTYGDASISLDHIEKQWSDWDIVGTDVSLLVPSQLVVFLRPKYRYT